MSRPRLWLLLLVLFALSVRVVGIDWDEGHHFHPDERAIVGAVERLSFNWNSLELNPKWFNYGTLPLYVIRAAADVAGFVVPALRSYDKLILVGRAVSAVAGTLTVLLLVLLGTRRYNVQVGLLAGFLLAAAPLHIQNSHYATTDIFLTFFVLLALYCFMGIVARGRWYDYAASGAAIGLAMATKFSAAPLLAPLGIALLVRLSRERRLLPVLGGGVLALAALGAAFFVGQPYAILDFAEYYKDIREQSEMVRFAGRLPYTNQYIGTPKYGYELYHLIVFGMAPALGLVAVWATVRLVAGLLRRSGEDIVLLAWVIPFFAVTGWFDVKFVRYLLPIYPPLTLWAAAWLRQPAPPVRLRQWLTWIVAGSTLLAAIALLSIYTRPHTIVTASEWVYRHVPSGSTILSQHWDEGFPFSLPNYPGRRFKVIELPYYEEDRPAKIQLISRHLADGDYIALQTKRLYGAVTRAPDKFPRTNNFFYLLFAGDLGYTLVYDHASRPGLFGLEFPDEILDESISVYDHPKVVIFQNTGHLTQEEIADKILRGFPSQQLTRDDLLLARAGDGAGGGAVEVTSVRSSWLALLWFATVVELLGLSLYALLYPRLPVSGSYALAKVLGVLVFAYIPWLLTGLGQVEFTRTTLALTILALGICGGVARARWQTRPTRREWWPTELLFWGSFAFFLLVRAFNPEAYWGEKPMDFAFLNALTRSTGLPPPEPWFAGSALHYSYFGHYVIAALGKICAIHPGITFNLGIALIAGLTTIAAFALGCALSDRWRVGLLAAFFATLLGNLAGPRELIARKVMNFDYFWATSRVIKDTINEYPFWSFLFADLHAHMLVMPFSVAFVTLALWWVRRDEGPRLRRLPLLFCLALTLGAVMVTNTWSSFTYIPFLPFLFGIVFLARRHGGVLRWLLHAITQVLLPTVAVCALAVALYLPYWRSWTAPESNWGWERDAFANLWDFVNIFGLFLFIGIPFVFAVWRGVLTRFGAVRLTGGQVLSMAVVALTIAVCFVLSEPAPHRLLGLGGVASVRTALALLGVVALHVALERSTPEPYRLTAILFSFAFFVTMGVDVLHVWDRMNTVFKFYLEAWFIFSAAAAAAAYELWRGGLRVRWLRRVWQGGLVVLVGVALFTGVTATYGILTTNRVRTPRPTLNGTAYLPQHDAHEAAAFEWLNGNIAGIPVIAEAYGPSYQEFARVSMNTGLPTVLGWDYHVYQRAHTWADINRRKADLEKLYTSDNKEAAKAILQKYHVALVYLGPLERRRYAGANLERFRQWNDVLTPVYQNASVTVFGVKGQFTTQQVATIEEVPSETGEVPPPPAEGGELHQPRGLAVNSQGIVFVADFDNHRIQAFDKDLEFVRMWGERGDLPGQFKQPCGVAVDASDSVYVADTWNQRVQIFNAEGQYLREFAGPYYGPRGIAVSASGDAVYLADTGNHRVRRFDRTGKETTSWGGLGEQPGQLKEPIGVAVDAEGRVYVCDNGNARLQIFDGNGRLETSFPVSGWETKVFSEPYVTLTPDGLIWVTVPLQKVVRGYDRSGNVVKEIGDKVGDKVLFKHPIGVAYDPTTHELVISDLENNLARLAVPE